MVTIKDVARAANVSTATVSRVVRDKGQVGDKCRAKVQKIIKQLGYRPNTNARALVSKRSDTMGIVTPNLSDPFFGGIAQGIEEVARQMQYKVMMGNSLHDEEGEIEAIASLRENGCENIIIHSKYSSNETLIKLCEELPGLVLINRFIPSIAGRCVWLDNTVGGRISTEYLLNNNHKDIAVLTSYYNNQDPHDRIRGFKMAMEMAGHTVKDELIFVSDLKQVIKQGQNGGNLEGESTAKRLLESGQKFTAIIAYNDHMAVGAMNLLLDNGIRVPEDVSIIGFDNVYVSMIVRPQLTTINYPVVQMAKYAAQLSIDLTKDKENVENKTHLFMPELIERNSVYNLKES